MVHFFLGDAHSADTAGAACAGIDLEKGAHQPDVVVGHFEVRGIEGQRGLEHAVDALNGLFTGANIGKTVVKVSDPAR